MVVTVTPFLEVIIAVTVVALEDGKPNLNDDVLLRGVRSAEVVEHCTGGVNSGVVANEVEILSAYTVSVTVVVFGKII